ncbi:hypothetical protein AURDEDRAFT_144493 [Auricularia subglabra TFB-10046 SS5]|nr:hypothetical protein AURDEDRAFT_144493 [Auricularia subglabra TFB-10046 SS5]
MSEPKTASYYDLIPPEAKEPRRYLKRAEANALRAVSTDTAAHGRITAKRLVIDQVKGARTTLTKLGGPELDLKATIHEVFERAIEISKAPVALEATRGGLKKKKKNPRKGVAGKFKLPRDVATPLTGSEDIARRYRVPRNPPDPTEISGRIPSEFPALHPEYKSVYKHRKHHAASTLADALRVTRITDEDQPGIQAAGSSRVPYPYTVSCLAADLQLASLGHTRTRDARDDEASSEKRGARK